MVELQLWVWLKYTNDSKTMKLWLTAYSLAIRNIFAGFTDDDRRPRDRRPRDNKSSADTVKQG